MTLSTKEIYSGFVLINKEPLPDINAEGYTFHHKKSGARLFYVKREDKNKVFFVSFKTPPHDDCGTAHIIEHSLLCGSKKYQAKDPFNELAKGSLNTYLNALTFSDKTMYPVASCNDQDFKNLMDVYLDAVFNPRIFERKEIFMQEGWHYELEQEQGPLKINGVVYNEMKGALSDPERLMNNCISKSLFPNSIYKFESGGDPDKIPELSYENFLDFYKEYYHPSNSYFYLYGDLDILEQLEYLDQNYLSEFEKIEVSSTIEQEMQRQKLFFLQDTYPVLDEKEKDCFFSYNVVAGKSTDPLLVMGLSILNTILLDTNASPLKKALMDAELGKEVEGWFDSSNYEMVFSILAKKGKIEKSEQFLAVLMQSLQEIVKNGLDQQLVESCLNIWEFYFKEEDFGYRPKGLAYGMKVMKSWLHSEDASSYLKHWKQFHKIKQESKSGYFENLIQEVFLNANHSSIVILKPETGKQARLTLLEKERLEKELASFPLEKRKQIQNEMAVLKQYQAEADSPEVLSQIPLLNIGEIDKQADFQDTVNFDIHGMPILFTPLKTNKIVYLRLFFSAKGIGHEHRGYVGLLSELLGQLDTTAFSFHQLPIEINRLTGGMNFFSSAYDKQDQSTLPVFEISIRLFSRNLGEVLALLDEILFRTDFTKCDHLKTILLESKSKLENDLFNQAHASAIRRSLAYYKESSRWEEETGGISYLKFLADLEQDYEKKRGQIEKSLSEITSSLFTKENLTIAFSSEQEQYPDIVNKLANWVNGIPDKKEIHLISDDWKPEKAEAFLCSSQVQYNVLATDLKKLGISYSGKMQVLKTILNLEYLWNVVRVQGGAYGSGCTLSRNGGVAFYSYRDPHMKSTFKAYLEISQFLKNLSFSEKEMTKFLLGTFNTLDRPLTNKSLAARAAIRSLCGITKEIVQKERDELFLTTGSDIKNYASLFDSMQKDYSKCVIGNENKIKVEKEYFEKIENLIL